jgi:hypothetical protein
MDDFRPPIRMAVDATKSSIVNMSVNIQVVKGNIIYIALMSEHIL